jgi:hypothetical protein
MLGLDRDALSTPGYFQNRIGRSGGLGHREINRLPRKDPTAEADGRRLVHCISAGIVMSLP